ncbi:hypothetical protein LUZ60_003847 [Juncus effusus]|nr:hypothetical protein LUZ60_003847 [Juncus effusus]
MGNSCYVTKIIDSESPSFISSCTSESGSGSGSFTSRISDSPNRLSPINREGEVLKRVNLREFSFEELKNATRNFRPDTVVGEGGFGLVFKGWVDACTFKPVKPGTGTVIAVKKLKQEGLQGHKEWLAEVNYLSQLSHPNLVKLIGYCLEDHHRLLVYEFMPNGSLENHLFKKGSSYEPLSWNLRMKIALEAAKVLAFLHSDEARVIYRDFKPSNILLDSNFTAKLSDFGLAKDSPHPDDDKSHVFTRIMGTYGYAAPEYLATGRLTIKSDVYSFGVVLLEILTGRRAIDRSKSSGQHILTEWARPYLSSKRKILRILDPRLNDKYSARGARRATKLARRCLSVDENQRPDMDFIVLMMGKVMRQM